MMAVVSLFPVSVSAAEIAAPAESGVTIVSAAMLQRGGMLNFSMTLHNSVAAETTLRMGAIFHPLAQGESIGQTHSVAAPDALIVPAESDQSASFSLPVPILPAGEYSVMVGVTGEAMTRMILQAPVGRLQSTNKNVMHVEDCRFKEQSFSEGVIEVPAGAFTDTLSCQVWADGEALSGRVVANLMKQSFGEAVELGVKEVRFSSEKAAVELTLEHDIQPGLYELVVFGVDTDGRVNGLSARTRLRVPGSTGQGSVVSGQEIQSMAPVLAVENPISSSPFFSLGFWLKAFFIGVFVLVVVFLALRRVRMARGTVAGLILFFGVFLGGLIPTHATQAAMRQFVFNTGCGSCAQTIWMDVYTQKDTYAPGEAILLDVVLSSDDFPVAPASPLLRAQVNSGSFSSDLITGSYNAQQLTQTTYISNLNTGRLAPASTGNFTLTISTGMSAPYSTPATQSMTLTVAATTSPTVTLSAFSPSTITAGESSTISLSSTDATSCSGDTGSIWVGNLGGTSFSNVSTGPMNAGTYTQRVTCTGPGGSTQSALRTLTVNASAPSTPTASLTVSPSGPVPEGTSINYSLSSTNAQSCEVVRNPGNVIELNRNTNQTSMNVSGPTGAGNWTFTTRCWSGTNGGGIVSATDNDALTITAAVAVSGTCGSAGGQTYDVNNSIIPNSNRCSTGTYDVGRWGSDAGAWYSNTPFDSNGVAGSVSGQLGYYMGRTWTCDGSGGGVTRGCILYYQPQCGSADGTGPLNSPPPSGTYFEKEALCDIGTMYNMTTTPTAYTWECRSGAGPTDFCSASRPVSASPVTAEIRAAGPVAFDQQSWWKKLISSVTGRDHVAQATGPNATITVGQNASITWTSSGAAFCTITKQGTSGNLSTTLNGSLTLTGLPVGTHTYLITCGNSSGATDSDSVQVIVNSTSSGTPGTPGNGGPGDFFSAVPGACGSGTINVSWNSESGATSYQLRDWGVQIYNGASTSFSHTGLLADSSHQYTVQASNSNGPSGYSGVRSAVAPSNTCSGPNFTITASAGSGGIIAPSGTVSGIPSGSSQSFVISANPGYSIDSLSIDGIYFGPSSSYTFNNITANHTISAAFVSNTSSGPVCGNGICEGGEFCSVCVDCGFCGVSISANPGSCSIAANQNSCTTNLTWTSGASNPRVTNSANTTLWTTANGNNQSTPVAYPGTVFQIRDGNTIQGSTPFVSATCASGSTWNVGLGRCEAASGNVNADPSCIIGLNQSTCNVNVTWNISGATSPNLYNQTRNVTYSNSATGNNQPFAVTNGANQIQIRDGSTVIGSASATGSCGALVWNGTTCQAVCNETVSCSTKEAEYCSGEIFTMTGVCGQLNCTGTRACDYNWKEVSP